MSRECVGWTVTSSVTCLIRLWCVTRHNKHSRVNRRELLLLRGPTSASWGGKVTVGLTWELVWVNDEG